MNKEEQAKQLINAARKNISADRVINDAMIQFSEDQKAHCKTYEYAAAVDINNLTVEQEELYMVASGILRERTYIQDMRYFNLKRELKKNEAQASKIFPKAEQFLNDNETWCEDHLSFDEIQLLAGVPTDDILEEK